MHPSPGSGPSPTRPDPTWGLGSGSGYFPGPTLPRPDPSPGFQARPDPHNTTVGTPRSMTARNASFFLDASTSVGPATLALHPEFEGTYDLQTTGPAQARVQEGEDTRDPAGKGRNRTVTRKSTGRHAQGEIYWSEEGRPFEERGAIRITTTVSPVLVDLFRD
ncbi:hypothetical protein C8R47DRAFT_1215557 [Mycena vitilis]|nr:hypothetical protein C8R47DRAFT_1215557 [Mycena vitilis]